MYKPLLNSENHSARLFSNPICLCLSGELELSEVAELFEKSILLQLKNECGGLQTLLRNHYHLFKGQLKMDCFLLQRVVCSDVINSFKFDLNIKL